MLKLVNPYSLAETVDLLRDVLAKTSTENNLRKDALELLEKAVLKANEDREYAKLMEETLLRGSTIELRDLLSVFGDYWAPPQSGWPKYPHLDAVNGIDSGMHIIKYDALYPGALQEYIEDYSV